jgi:glycosyltransferase involved in cell wall biosynthesis
MSSRWGVLQEGKLSTHFSSGRVIDELARHFKKFYLSVALYANGATSDYVLQAENIELFPQPGWQKAVEGLRHPVGVLKSVKRLVDLSDVVFIRGFLPYIPLVYLYAAIKNKPLVHWVVTNPSALIQAARRNNKVTDRFSYIYSMIDSFCLRFFQRMFNHIYIAANGCELYRKFRNPRTFMVVSSTIRENEFFWREDTCQGENIRVLFASFIRPEKGLTFLIEALAKLKTSRNVVLAVVGDTQSHPQEVGAVRRKIVDLGLEDKVTWEGYASCGSGLFDQMRKSDIFVLPTLSEGTPRVLIEARAFGLPIIASKVGGIPSSVTNGKDGILVPAKSPDDLATAIDKIIENPQFRQKLIRNGYNRAKQHTLEKFTGSMIKIFKHALESMVDAG